MPGSRAKDNHVIVLVIRGVPVKVSATPKIVGILAIWRIADKEDLSHFALMPFP